MIDPYSYKLPLDFDLPAAMAAIACHFPAAEPARVMANGFDNIAIITASHVFRFPRHESALTRLVQEAHFLSLIRDHVDLAVPDLQIHDGPPVFSSHRLIEGESLGAPEYLALNEDQRDALARTLARFYAQLHAIPVDRTIAAGAGPVEYLPVPERLLTQVLPLLPTVQQDWAKRTVAAWQSLPTEDDRVFSWFDGHGWNMAFDRDTGQLNGAFDFADAAIGALHWDLQHTNLIHPDLTRRMIIHYQMLTGRHVDLYRIAVLTGIHRLSDLALSCDAPEFGDLTRELLEEWFRAVESHL